MRITRSQAQQDSSIRQEVHATFNAAIGRASSPSPSPSPSPGMGMPPGVSEFFQQVTDVMTLSQGVNTLHTRSAALIGRPEISTFKDRAQAIGVVLTGRLQGLVGRQEELTAFQPQLIVAITEAATRMQGVNTIEGIREFYIEIGNQLNILAEKPEFAAIREEILALPQAMGELSALASGEEFSGIRNEVVELASLANGLVPPALRLLGNMFAGPGEGPGVLAFFNLV